MTADYFYMNVRSDCVEISVEDGRMKTEAEIDIDDFVFAFLHSNDNLDMIAKPVKDELIHRAENAWDESTITDEELDHFKKVLEVIL